MTKSSKIVVGFWRRFFADFLDALILGIPGYGIGYLFRYTFSAMGMHAIWIGLVCSFLYYGLMHTRLGGGQTPGKRLLGIQVLRRDGQYLSFGKSFLRYLVVSFIFYNGLYGSLINHLPQSTMMAVGSVYLLVIIWSFFACFLMIPLHPLKRGLHDIAADSVVVYKDCFDNEALDQMEDSAKVKRAMVILSVGSCFFAGACIWGLLKFTSGLSGDMAKLTEIQKSLEVEYDVPQVRTNIFNGKAVSLAVVIYVPLATYENKMEKERIRQEVLNKVKTRFNDLDRFGKLRVVIASGFSIGIANFNTSD
ncbi:RDD family protein [Geomonas sp. Red69]|uniref:RDD family protein n=1 Tax=Geomonas diazotrophica TaxID=2843197 RepID=A0ABX8JG36_9BACT|nr:MULTISPECIES: RDD family protein [Geomonas]MBU5636280.1 RDD family protein [Geomonas diazotrophica]QWV96172.1 RDD family protein [Geomonas nitrogeniifigens]QXE85239.1 RDD family protein [Geomonas nitrogeniifigens]